MKRLFITLSICLSTLGVWAQGSVELGDSGEYSQLTPNRTGFGDFPILFDDNNRIYVAFTDNGMLDYRGEVLKPSWKTFIVYFNGTKWQRVGEALTTEPETYPSLAMDKFKNLYVAFKRGNQPQVKKLNFANGSWEDFGVFPTLIDGIDTVASIYLQFDSKNTPYLTFNTNHPNHRFVFTYIKNGNNWELTSGGGFSSRYHPQYEENGQFGVAVLGTDSSIHVAAGGFGTKDLKVFRYEPTIFGWQQVGPATGLPVLPADTFATDCRIAFNSAGELHLVYGNLFLSKGLKVIKLKNNAWEDVGGIIPNNVRAFNIHFGPGDTPYIVSHSDIGDYGFRVFKLVGNSWENIVAQADFKNKASGRIAFDKNGNLFAVLIDFLTLKGEVRRYNGSSWIKVGGNAKAGLSTGEVSNTIIKVAKNGTPFVIYRDITNDNKAIVKLFNADSNAWYTVGAGPLSAGSALSLNLHLDSAGVPFAVFADGANGFKTTMKRFNGTDWVNVGAPAFSQGSVRDITMAVMPDGKPITAYTDNGFSGKATVKLFNGSWVFVGQSGFSAGSAKHTSMAVNKAGVPYVAYADESLGSKLVVKTFNGTSWTDAGTGTISSDSISSAQIVFNESVGFTDNEVYALMSSAVTGSLTVSTINNNTWVPVGNSNFTDSVGGGGSIGLDRLGTPYVIFGDPAYDYRASIMTFNGSSWVYFGEPGFSAGRVENPTLSFDTSGNLFVVYSSSQAFARKFATGGNVGVGEAVIEKLANNIYPNPNETGLLKIEIPFEDIGKTFTIYDLQGKVCYTDKLSAEYNEIPLDNFRQGMYLIKIAKSPQIFKLIVK